MSEKRLNIFRCITITFLLLGFLSFSTVSAQTQAMENAAQGEQGEPKQEKPTVLDQLKELPSETTAPIKTEKIDKAGEKISDHIEKIEKEASSRWGDWIDAELFWGITWLKLGFCLSILFSVFVFERLLHFFIKRRLKKQSDEAAPPTWHTILLRGISKPLSLFIWVYGTYGALSPLFSHFAKPGALQLFHNIAKWCADLGGTIAALWAIYRLLHLVDFQVTWWARSKQGLFGSGMIAFSKCSRAPVKMLIFLIFFRLAVPFFGLGEVLQTIIGQVFSLLLIAAVAWLIIEGTCALEDVLLGYYKMDVSDNLAARKVHTQVRFLRRLTVALTVILAGASMLMVFEKVRQLGAGILASAGILGIVVGLAAQRSIANLLVGLQVAITQPIRLDDVVIVENEWGRVEEITTTYVVVKIWDLRRLIVPITYFTEKPFQNWTRVSAELLGTVFLYVDYTVPVEAVRRELHGVLEASEFWNGKAWGLQVTNTTPQAMELRLLMSADDASAAWSLRCEVREKMITFVQQNFPESLPKIRAEFRQEKTGEAPPFLEEARGDVSPV